MLERIEGVDMAIFLQGRQLEEVLEEVRRFMVIEGVHSQR